MKPRKLPSHPPFEPAEADIQKRAYFLWQEEGRPDGRDLEIWLTAREMLLHGAAVRDRAPAATKRTRRAAASPFGPALPDELAAFARDGIGDNPAPRSG